MIKQKFPAHLSGEFFYIPLKNKLQNRSGKNGNGEKESGKAKTFDFVNVVAEKNKKSGSCADGKSGKCRAEGNCSFSKKLGDYNRGSAVGDKTDKTRNKGLEKAFVCNKSGKTINNSRAEKVKFLCPVFYRCFAVSLINFDILSG